jgi:hypothetical protein
MREEKAMNWSDLFQYIIKRPLVLLPLCVTGLVVLFVPSISGFFGINKLSPQIQPFVGLITLFAILFLLTVWVRNLYCFQKDRRNEEVDRKQRIWEIVQLTNIERESIQQKQTESLNYLDTLSEDEFLVIATCLEKETRTAATYGNVAAALEGKGIVKNTAPDAPANNQAYLIPDFIWTELLKRKESILTQAEAIWDRIAADRRNNEIYERQKQDELLGRRPRRNL